MYNVASDFFLVTFVRFIYVVVYSCPSGDLGVAYDPILYMQDLLFILPVDDSGF